MIGVGSSSTQIVLGFWMALSIRMRNLGSFMKTLIGCSHNQMKQKNMSNDHQNFIKIVILLHIFLWCHFNAMSIMEWSVEWLISMLKNSKKNSKKKIWVLVLVKILSTLTTIA
jgi:hypothetical protein